MEQKHKWKNEIIAWLNGETVQWSYVDKENWRDLDYLAYPFGFDNPRLKFRIVPKTIKVNGHEVPEPCREAPKHNTKYFYPCPSHPDTYGTSYWDGDEDNFHHLKKGFVHLTAEAAFKHAEALLSFTREIEASEADDLEQHRLDKERQTKELGLTKEEIKIFDLNIDEREEIIAKVWSEMKDALCLDHRTFGHQLIEEVFKKRGEK